MENVHWEKFHMDFKIFHSKINLSFIAIFHKLFEVLSYFAILPEQAVW